MKKPAETVAGVMSGIFVFWVALAAPASAQRGDPAKARLDDQSRREAQLRVNESQPKNGTDPQLKALMAQIEEDFNQILTLHNRIARATAADERIDYQFVSEAAGEIRKRAGRLQNSLALKPADGDQNQPRPVAFDDANFKDGLILLCKQIKSFVTNPVIETPGKVDPDQTARARSDLEGIVELSGLIKKSAERLNKTSR